MRTHFRAFLLFVSLFTAAIACSAQRNRHRHRKVYDRRRSRSATPPSQPSSASPQRRTAADGTFRFENVPPRHYHVRAESPRLGFNVGEADRRRRRDADWSRS